MPGISTGLGTPNELGTTSWTFLVAQPSRFVGKASCEDTSRYTATRLSIRLPPEWMKECARRLRLKPQIQAATANQIAMIGLMQIGAPKHVVSQMISDR